MDGGNSRNGKRSKTVPTGVGPVEMAVPHDRDGSFEPKIVKKRQKRLAGVDEMVISLATAHLALGTARRNARIAVSAPTTPPAPAGRRASRGS